VIHSFVESKTDMIKNLFAIKCFFQLSEKQPVVLSNQPVVLLLGVLKKVENCFGLVDLTVKPNNWLFRGFNRLFL